MAYQTSQMIDFFLYYQVCFISVGAEKSPPLRWKMNERFFQRFFGWKGMIE